MNNPRVFFVCLGLLAALYIGGAGIGSCKDQNQGGAKPEQAPWAQSLGNLTAPLAPKVKLTPEQWDLSGLNDRKGVDVPADPKAGGSRVVTFLLTQVKAGAPALAAAKPASRPAGVVLVEYIPPGGRDAKGSARVTLPRADAQDEDSAQHGSLVVGDAGGKIEFTLLVNGSARVEAKAK